MDVDDQDAPPDLVETGGNVDEEETTVKVPITIVTGTWSSPRSGNTLGSICTDGVISADRVPRCWQNYTSELHIDSSTWQEGCCHHERCGDHKIANVYVFN